MDRKLTQKSFSDVLEQAIKERWGKKRKMPSVNFPLNTKKCKAQPVGYSTSQQDSQQTSIADHESFSQSQPISSEKKLPFYAKQGFRGWTPPLKRYQEVMGKNVSDVNSITTLKPPKNNLGSKEYMDVNNLRESSAQANSLNCEAENGSENVPLDKYATNKVNSMLFNSINEKKDSLGSASLGLKDNTGLVYQDQTSNIQQCIKSQCSPASTDSAVHASTSRHIQSSIFDKEAEMENSTSLDQISNESKEYEMAIATVSGNNNSTLIESIANSEEVLSNTNTETDIDDEDIFCQQLTQPYPLNDNINITDEEDSVIDEEEVENPSDNREAILLSPKENILKNPLYMTNDIHNTAINAFMINNAENEEIAKDSTLCSAKPISSKNVTTAKEEKLLPGKEVQDTLDSKEFNEFLKKEPSKSMFTSFIFKSEMAQNQKCWPVSEQNDDKCITETDNSINPRGNCTNGENITGANGCVSEESTVIINGTNSLEEKNINKEYEKNVCFQIKPQSTEIIGSESCDEIRTHTDGVYAGTDKYSDVEAYTKALEAKFQNIFNFEHYIERISGKENISVFDNKEKSPITDIKITQDLQMKISETGHAFMAATKLSQDPNGHQKSITNMNTASKQDMQMKISENDHVFMAATKLSQEPNAHQGPITNMSATSKQDMHMKISENHAFITATKLSQDPNAHQGPITNMSTTSEQNMQMKISENDHAFITATKLSKDSNAHQGPITNMSTTSKQDMQMKISENHHAFITATKLSQDSNVHQGLININATPKQDTQIKISENGHAFMTATKLSQDLNVHQKSEDVIFIEEAKLDKTKDDKEISTAACDGPSVVESACEPSESAFKWTEHTDKEAFIKDTSKVDRNAVVLPVEAANLQMDQITLKVNDEDQNIRSPNNNKLLDVKEKIILPATEKRNDLVVPHKTEHLIENINMEEKPINYQQASKVTSTASSQSIVNNDSNIHSEDKEKNKMIVFKDNFNSQSNRNDLVFEKETLTENNSEEKIIKCQKNINQNETVNSENNFGSEPAITNSGTSHAVDKERAYIADFKFTKENLVQESGSSEIEKNVHEMKTNCSQNDRLGDKLEAVIYTACLNSSTKKASPPSTDLKDQISNDYDILSSSKREQHPLKTENKTEDLILTNNKEHTQFKNNKQPENNNSVLIPSTAINKDVAIKNNNTDFSEMEDDFGLTASQILRIEDECQQKTFKPEMPPIQWAQKVKESRRKIQAVIQEIGMLNAMLKKARKEVWQPPSNATAGEGTSAAEDFNTFSRPTSHSWNRNLKSKFGQNMQNFVNK